MQKEKKLYYLLLFIILFLSSLLIIPICLLLLFPRVEGNALYLRMMAAYPLSLAILSVMMKKAGGKGLRDLIGKIDWKLFLTVFIIFFLYSAVSGLIKGGIERNPAPISTQIISLIISITTIPMQCVTEELLFRILIQKAVMTEDFASLWKKKLTALLISSAFFSSLHLANSEALLFGSIMLSFSYYFLSGAFLFALTLITRDYSANISYHIANNMFIAAIVNRAKGATIPSSSFFIFEGNFNTFDTVFSFIGAIVIIMAGIKIYLRHKRRADKIG